MPVLFRRREIWLPTLWGAIGVVALLAVLGLALLAHLGRYLAPTEPALRSDGSGARVLVVEGWLDDEALDQAIALVRNGRYERIVTSGGPIETWREIQPWPTYADRAAAYLLRRGVRASAVAAAPAPPIEQDRSYLSAVVVRDWARTQDLSLDAIDVFSDGVHARRSRLVYRMAFGPDVDVGIVAATPRRWRVDRWWTTSEGTKSVLDELLSLTWTKCCFWPARGEAG
ncbi:MAG: hypothetical protein JO090_11225, partial [Rhizobacter sp.]|nr:hypothetical protein [Rhizobacter sp.]